MISLYDLYALLPVCLQERGCSLEGWRIQQRRYGGDFLKILAELEARAQWTHAQMEEFRDRRLAGFFRDVICRTPFYQRRYREAGIDPSRVRCLDDLRSLPVLNKETVQEKGRELVPKGVHSGRTLLAHTSGTTGSGLSFAITFGSEREQWAVWWRYRRWHGISFDTWCGFFGGRQIVPVSQIAPPFWRVNSKGRQILFSGHHMSPANLPLYVSELRRLRLPWLHGYPSLLALLAEYLIDRGEDLGYGVRWITVGAESLSGEQAALLERAFGTRPRQHYGMAEGVANFSECEQGRLHVDEDFAAVEFVSSGDGCTHRVIGTNLSNPRTPLVRYDVRDLVILGRGSCPCGRPGRTVESVDGRAEDFLVLRDGRRFGPANHLFKHMVNVREAQMYQKYPGEITIRIVRGAHFSPRDEHHLLQEIGRRLGAGNRLDIKYVEATERGLAGKHKAVISELTGSEARCCPELRWADRVQEKYTNLPIVLQNVACSVEGWRLERSRYRGDFPRLLQQVESRSRWSHDDICEFRDRRLRQFLLETVAKIPFYQRRCREFDVRLEEVDSLTNLGRLPILTKADIQGRTHEVESGASLAGQRAMAHTSGTTGSGLRFATTLGAIREQWAVWWRYRRWHGIDHGTWCGLFAGRSIVAAAQCRPPFWRVNYPARQVLFSAYHIAPSNLPFYVAELQRRKLPWLHGYPSVLALVATYLVDTGADLGYQPRWITTGAENLLPQQAELIRRAFGTKPRQHYGMAEAVANFSECDLGKLHTDEDFGAVEFVPAGDNTYRVVGTNLSNPATPLVRYDTGDIVTLLDGTCPCGRPGRLVDRIDGRQEDYVILWNGARVGRLDHIFKDMLTIREAQIYQQKPGAIVYRIVPGKDYGPQDELRLLHETRLRLGESTSVRVDYTDRIERTAGGKLRFVVSEIGDARILDFEPGAETVHRG